MPNSDSDTDSDPDGDPESDPESDSDPDPDSENRDFRHTSFYLFFVRETFFIIITSTVKSVDNGKGTLPHPESSPGHQNSRIRIIFQSVPSMAINFLTPGYSHSMFLTIPILTRILPHYASHFPNPQSWSAEVYFRLAVLEARFLFLHSKSDS